MLRSARTVLRALALAATVAFASGCGDDDPTGPNTGTLRVRNQSQQTVIEIYYSACTSPEWGEDRLGADVLAPSASRDFTVAPGCWDFMAVKADDSTEETTGIEVSRGEVIELTITN
jgi:hypothetical protein